MQIFRSRRPKKRWVVLGAAFLGLAALYGCNASWPASPDGELTILAHRGPHQRFRTEGLTNESCTASMALPITHGYLENTLPSIAAAYAMGADIVELDIHPTTDGELAVFHDWTLDCRTNGKGVTREQSMTYLKTLDVAYGYTADGGQTYPLRGTGVGMMPTLAEVVRAFPGRSLLINIKSNDPAEADKIDAYLDARGIDDSRFSYFAGPKPAARLQVLRPSARIGSKRAGMDCLKGYAAWGWIGHVPDACRAVGLGVPIVYRRLFWGWPDRLVERMEKAGAEVYVMGEVDWSRKSAHGLDSLEDLRKLPKGWRGGVMTDRIEVIGPALRPAGSRARTDGGGGSETDAKAF